MNQHKLNTAEKEIASLKLVVSNVLDEALKLREKIREKNSLSLVDTDKIQSLADKEDNLSSIFAGLVPEPAEEYVPEPVIESLASTYPEEPEFVEPEPELSHEHYNEPEIEKEHATRFDMLDDIKLDDKTSEKIEEEIISSPVFDFEKEDYIDEESVNNVFALGRQDNINDSIPLEKEKVVEKEIIKEITIYYSNKSTRMSKLTTIKELENKKRKRKALHKAAKSYNKEHLVQNKNDKSSPVKEKVKHNERKQGLITKLIAWIKSKF